MTKTVLLSGYYGCGNVGDELILKAILDRFNECDSLEVIVASADPAQTAKDYGVKTIDRRHLKAIFFRLRDCQALISGGGGLLQDVTSSRSLYYYLGIMELAIILGKPVIIYAQGIGPIRNSINRFITRTVLKRASLITLREEQSAKVLEGLGFNRQDLMVTADPVLSLPSLAPAEKGKGIGVVIRPLKSRPNLAGRIARILDELAEKFPDIPFTLIPFHPQYDFDLAQEIKLSMKHKIGIFVGYGLSKYIEAIERLDLLIGMRLHALILAAINQVPMVGISIDPKIDSFIQAVDQPLITLETADKESMISLISHVWEDRENYQERLKKLVPPLRQKAEATFRLVVDFLEKGDYSTPKA
ncbi:MAG: polysaccharide pyruvyl transferase CsaB [bacterium]